MSRSRSSPARWQAYWQADWIGSLVSPKVSCRIEDYPVPSLMATANARAGATRAFRWWGADLRCVELRSLAGSNRSGSGGAIDDHCEQQHSGKDRQRAGDHNGLKAIVTA